MSTRMFPGNQEREAAQAVERAIYGDLFPICSQVGKREQVSGLRTEVGKCYGSTRNRK